MPVYDFRCQDCNKRFTVTLSYSEYDRRETLCPACRSVRVERVIRKVRVSRGDRGRLASMADENNLDALDSDPRALGKMMRELKGEVGASDLPGEFDEVVDRLEKGQSPEEIDRDFPDSGAEDASSEP
jgi:putative FmdB family regulatory protein